MQENLDKETKQLLVRGIIESIQEDSLDVARLSKCLHYKVSHHIDIRQVEINAENVLKLCAKLRELTP